MTATLRCMRCRDARVGQLDLSAVELHSVDYRRTHSMRTLMCISNALVLSMCRLAVDYMWRGSALCMIMQAPSLARLMKVNISCQEARTKV